ncbi:MAG: hypothetical protein II767_01530 [Proteobacteria bacterium]|nr:hypothetical protein [Pseudomonadota bacterium]
MSDLVKDKKEDALTQKLEAQKQDIELAQKMAQQSKSEAYASAKSSASVKVKIETIIKVGRDFNMANYLASLGSEKKEEKTEELSEEHSEEKKEETAVAEASKTEEKVEKKGPTPIGQAKVQTSMLRINRSPKDDPVYFGTLRDNDVVNFYGEKDGYLEVHVGNQVGYIAAKYTDQATEEDKKPAEEANTKAVEEAPEQLQEILSHDNLKADQVEEAREIIAQTPEEHRAELNDELQRKSEEPLVEDTKHVEAVNNAPEHLQQLLEKDSLKTEEAAEAHQMIAQTPEEYRGDLYEEIQPKVETPEIENTKHAEAINNAPQHLQELLTQDSLKTDEVADAHEMIAQTPEEYRGDLYEELQPKVEKPEIENTKPVETVNNAPQHLQELLGQDSLKTDKVADPQEIIAQTPQEFRGEVVEELQPKVEAPAIENTKHAEAINNAPQHLQELLGEDSLKADEVADAHEMIAQTPQEFRGDLYEELQPKVEHPEIENAKHAEAVNNAPQPLQQLLTQDSLKTEEVADAHQMIAQTPKEYRSDLFEELQPKVEHPEIENSKHAQAINNAPQHLQQLLGQDSLKTEEVAEAREMIAQTPEEYRGDLFEELQLKAEKTVTEGASQEVAEFDNLATCMTVLGVGNPVPEQSMTNTLMQVKNDQKLADGPAMQNWGSLANAMGVDYQALNMTGDRKAEEKTFWMKNVREELRSGQAVMASIDNQAVRIEGVEDEGLVVTLPEKAEGTFSGFETYNGSTTEMASNEQKSKGKRSLVAFDNLKDNADWVISLG